MFAASNQLLAGRGQRLFCLAFHQSERDLPLRVIHLTLRCHQLGNCQTYSDAIAVWLLRALLQSAPWHPSDPLEGSKPGRGNKYSTLF